MIHIIVLVMIHWRMVSDVSYHVSRELCVLVYSMFELKTRTDGIILSVC